MNHVYDRHEKKFIVIPIWPFLPQLQQVFFYEYFRLLQKTGFSLKIFQHMPLGVPENEIIVATAASKSHVKYVTASLFAKRVGRRLCTTCAEKECNCLMYSRLANGFNERSLFLECEK